MEKGCSEEGVSSLVRQWAGGAAKEALTGHIGDRLRGQDGSWWSRRLRKGQPLCPERRQALASQGCAVSLQSQVSQARPIPANSAHRFSRVRLNTIARRICTCRMLTLGLLSFCIPEYRALIPFLAATTSSLVSRTIS